MKAIRSNTTTIYAAVVVTAAISLNFRKENNIDEIAIFGDIQKDGRKVGRVSFNKANNDFSTCFEKFAEVTPEEIAAVYAKVPFCLQEMLVDVPETIPEQQQVPNPEPKTV